MLINTSRKVSVVDGGYIVRQYMSYCKITECVGDIVKIAECVGDIVKITEWVGDIVKIAECDADCCL